MEGGKPENLEKNPRSRDENQQQTQPTCDVGSGNRTRATTVGGERSHHCIPVQCIIYDKTIIRFGFCDIQNNQGLDKGYQHQAPASADNPYLDLEYSGYHSEVWDTWNSPSSSSQNI